VYAAGLFATDYAHLLTTPGTIAADVAGIAMILILLTANGFVRRRHYEFFYIAHTILIIVSLITGKYYLDTLPVGASIAADYSLPVCYHTSKAARHSLYMALIATSIYTLDRALRFSRFLYYVPTNTATLTPLVASKATRVTLTRSMAHSAPGSHAFLYMPGIRACQTHPFTMVNRDPVEFVISARNGFTKDLFKAACEKPGRTMRTGLEGAYGCVPNIARYDRVVLFAGGSGATFTFALAVNWAKNQDAESKKSLDFIWSVRTAGKSMTLSQLTGGLLTPSTAQLAGFVPELAVLKAHPRINIRVHMTKMSESQAEKLGTQAAVDDAPQLPSSKIEAVKPTSITDADDATLPPYAVPGRPDVQSTVRRIASECDTNRRVLVAACGPSGLSDNVRDAVRDCTSIDGPSLDLHLEAFGW
jgi:predicted ferric reductase